MVGDLSTPATRVLALLELLQTHGRLSGPELARRLGIGERSVRRYILLMGDIGIPIEAGRGRHGGYRLRPGYRLPPLMFSDEEAVAVVLGLLLLRQTRLAGTPADAEGALAKVERVMPDRLRTRVRALQEAVVLAGRSPSVPPAAAALIATLGEAAHRRRRVRLRYRSRQGAETVRAVDVYGVVGYEGRWYAVGHDHLRSDLRTFRVDRVLDAQIGDEGFAPPPGFDPVAYVEHALATMPGAMTAEVLLQTTLAEARRLVPAAAATLEEVPGGVLIRGHPRDRSDLALLARDLLGLPVPLVVREPPELREELRRLAAHAAALAERGDDDR